MKAGEYRGKSFSTNFWINKEKARHSGAPSDASAAAYFAVPS
jgi:hypothetical protein